MSDHLASQLQTILTWQEEHKWSIDSSLHCTNVSPVPRAYYSGEAPLIIRNIKRLFDQLVNPDSKTCLCMRFSFIGKLVVKTGGRDRSI